ncbi:MAG: C1 family peptidase, partial [Candidatus Dormibacteraceae bacterium]
WPYDIATFFSRPSPACYHDALKERVTEYLRLAQVLSPLLTCLASGYPIAFGFTVYESFESERVRRTGIAELPHPSEPVVGGHAVVACGYDLSQRRFLVRNSWGPGWGMDGYFTMPFEYLTNPYLAADFWTIRKVPITA